MRAVVIDPWGRKKEFTEKGQLIKSVKRRKYPFRINFYAGANLVYVIEYTPKKGGLFRHPIPPEYENMSFPPNLVIRELFDIGDVIEVIKQLM